MSPVVVLQVLNRPARPAQMIVHRRPDELGVDDRRRDHADHQQRPKSDQHEGQTELDSELPKQVSHRRWPYQPVAHAVHRLHVDWLGGARLDLLAQVLDVAVQRAIQPFVIIPQSALDQFRAGKRIARIAHHDLEQVELGRGQAGRLAIDQHLPAGRIQHQAAALEGIRPLDFLPRVAAQHRPDARHDLARVEGLGHVIVRAQFQPYHLVGILHPRREHDDECLLERAVAAHDPGDIPPAAIGQHQVQHHQRGPVVAQDVQGRLAIARRQNGITGLLQIRPDQAHDLRVVVHDQNPAVGFRAPHDHSHCHLLLIHPAGEPALRRAGSPASQPIVDTSAEAKASPAARGRAIHPPAPHRSWAITSPSSSRADTAIQ